MPNPKKIRVGLDFVTNGSMSNGELPTNQWVDPMLLPQDLHLVERVYAERLLENQGEPLHVKSSTLFHFSCLHFSF